MDLHQHLGSEAVSAPIHDMKDSQFDSSVSILDHYNYAVRGGVVYF